MSKFQETNFKGKKALIRVDFNVPLDDKYNITDDSRMKAAVPTIKKILGDGGSVILMSHLGRPKDGPTEKYSLKHLVNHLSELLGTDVRFANDCIGQEAISNALRHGNPNSILVHLRYDESALRMIIHDDGKGFAVDRAGRRGHFGLLVMEERARKVGGRFHLQSGMNRGTEITVELPYAYMDPSKRTLDHQVIRWIGL